MKARTKLLAILTCIITFSYININAQPKIIKNLKKPKIKITPNIPSPKPLPKIPIPHRPIPLVKDSTSIFEKNKNSINLIQKRSNSLRKQLETYQKTLNVLIEKNKRRFINYVKINSQSTRMTNKNIFPMTQGQIKMAKYLEYELREICKGSDVIITRSKDQYVYVKIPSNIKEKNIPSLMFIAHLDVTPEGPTQNVTPIVHKKYKGGNITLSKGKVLSPHTPQGSHLKNCIGKTIITSDGSTFLGADDKAGVTILVGLIETLAHNKSIKHGNVYIVFSQNEKIGRAADRFESKYVDGCPNIVINVDGNMPNKFSVKDFTVSMITYHFYGHYVNPSKDFANKYGDVLTAASYFIGQIDSAQHSSASKDKQRYIHYSSLPCPKDSTNKKNSENYLITVNLHYFDKYEGDTLRQILKNAEKLTAAAYPFVKIVAEPGGFQHENIAYTMHPNVTDLIIKSAKRIGMTMKPCNNQGDSTTMSSTKELQGNLCIYSAQQATHSVYEWVCVEDMIQMISFIINIVKNVATIK